jgi:hypothetical protein
MYRRPRAAGGAAGARDGGAKARSRGATVQDGAEVVWPPYLPGVAGGAAGQGGVGNGVLLVRGSVGHNICIYITHRRRKRCGFSSSASHEGRSEWCPPYRRRYLRGVGAVGMLVTLCVSYPRGMIGSEACAWLCHEE